MEEDEVSQAVINLEIARTMLSVWTAAMNHMSLSADLVAHVISVTNNEPLHNQLVQNLTEGRDAMKIALGRLHKLSRMMGAEVPDDLDGIENE